MQKFLRTKSHASTLRRCAEIMPVALALALRSRAWLCAPTAWIGWPLLPCPPYVFAESSCPATAPAQNVQCSFSEVTHRSSATCIWHKQQTSDHGHHAHAHRWQAQDEDTEPACHVGRMWTSSNCSRCGNRSGGRSCLLGFDAAELALRPLQDAVGECDLAPLLDVPLLPPVGKHDRL